MRALVITRLFPNRVQPTFAPFNQKQFSALADNGVSVRVICPIPWFPGAELLGERSRAGGLGEVPRRDTLGPLGVSHPRYLHLPRLLSAHAPLYAASLAAEVRKLKGEVDVIVSPFAYPDGVASVMLGELIGVPVVVKLHGGDMNVGANLPGPGRWIRWAFPRAARIIAVSEPLAELATQFGVPRDRVDVVQDGVDDQVFRVRDASGVRRELGYPQERRPIVFVGRLERRKGVFELLTAFEAIRERHPDVDLVLVGHGEDTEACREIAQRSGDRIRLVGNLPMQGVADWLSASEIVTLPSHAEGTPNAVIEALASGRPVVASSVGGIPQMLHDPRMGELTPAHDPKALAAAFERVLEGRYDAEEIVRLSGRGTWHDSARDLEQSLSKAIEAR